jgi:hypothetical protein
MLNEAVIHDQCKRQFNRVTAINANISYWIQNLISPVANDDNNTAFHIKTKPANRNVFATLQSWSWLHIPTWMPTPRGDVAWTTEYLSLTSGEYNAMQIIGNSR